MSYFDPSDQYKKSRPIQRSKQISNDIYKAGQKRIAQKTPPRMPKARALTLIAHLKKGVVAASFLCFGTMGIVIMRNSTATTTVQPKSKVTTTITAPAATSIATPTVTSGSTPTPVATSTPTPTATSTSSSGGYGFGSGGSSQSPVTSSQSS